MTAVLRLWLHLPLLYNRAALRQMGGAHVDAPFVVLRIAELEHRLRTPAHRRYNGRTGVTLR